MTALFVQVSAKSAAQRVTISAKNAPLLQLFNELRLQTGYDFLYSDEMLKMARPVTINVKQQRLETVLEQMFANQQLVYTLKKDAVIVAMKEQTIVDRVSSFFATIDVRGKVTDEQGRPLPGATVKVKSQDKLVITDVNGSFLLKGLDEKAVLVISYLGYKTKEVPVKAIMNISIEPANANLEEVGVVSTGYQKIKKDQITGAASTLNEEQYQQRVAVTGNFLESLEGKVPGLVYNSQSGELTIRGVSTFDAVKQPLIVLDGFPTEIDLRTINPNDIVSINVLRDAAAASIYGVRASNGVIIVETRRGKSGKPVFNLRTSYAIQNAPDFGYLNYAPASEFVKLQTENFKISGTDFFLFEYGYYKMNPVEEILFGQTELSVSNPLLTQAQADQKLMELGSYDNLKEYERLFYQKRQAKNINFDLSGGNERSTYMLGVNYINELPVNRRSENKQFTLNMANTFKFSERFSFDFKGTYFNNKDVSGNTPGYSDFFPYERLTDENGNALAMSLDPNRNFLGRVMTKEKNETLMAAGLYDMLYYPYNELSSNTNTSKGSSVKFQGRLNAKVTDWLNLDLGGNFENQNLTLDRLQTDGAYAVRTLINTMALRDPATGKALFTNMPQGNVLKRTNQKVTNYTVRGQLNLAHKFDGDNHDFSGIMGVEQKKTVNPTYVTSFFGYDGQTLITNPINMSALNGTSRPVFTDVGLGSRFRSTDYYSESEMERRFMSYYGQGTYIFKGKYVATGSFRIDQSNLFGVDPKYKNKPLWSAGLNWRLGKEDFVKQLDWVDNLQLRAATGFNGNVPTSNNGAFLILSTALNTVLTTPLTYNDVLTPENQSLRWETTKNYNLGLDYSLLKGRVSGSLDWYMKKTTDVFGQFDADPTSGFNQYKANTATIQNRGIELLINSLNAQHGKFKWGTQLTASLNNNKVLAVKATEYANSQLITSGTNIVKGMPIGALYSYNYGGLNAMGQPYVLDKNGNQKVLAFYGTAQVDVTKDDLIYNGTTTPKYVLGLNNQFSLGSFDLSFLFMYYGGHVMRVEQPDPNNIGFYANNPLKGSSNFWRKAGDESFTNIPGYTGGSSLAPGYYQSYALYGYNYASQFVRKADYIRLRDVVITYNAKAPFLEKIGLMNTSLRFQAQNVFRYTFSGNDIDPEAIDRISGVRKLETQPFYSLTFSTNF
ncbi:SusC/RagA family TonB-linked outer membrane protein [Pedobacter nyackensis]|uniref:SusC/RagA family TonB-linked outer membrane protein n=1 Tax=Pedobacter nyackensis TaxID=475255 RepID=UPI002930BA77|nr:SusC/RagA family TonB-linked outer membrane protein [Pedobacter nyackensis]